MIDSLRFVAVQQAVDLEDRLQPELGDQLERTRDAGDGAFHLLGAPAVDPPVDYLASKRIPGPRIFDRDRVHMGSNGQSGLAVGEASHEVGTFTVQLFRGRRLLVGRHDDPVGGEAGARAPTSIS